MLEGGDWRYEGKGVGDIGGGGLEVWERGSWEYLGIGSVDIRERRTGVKGRRGQGY